MRRLPGLDLLRAIAIVWVMLFHSYIVGGLGPSFALIQNDGWMGVDLFFALSGYLIGSQLLQPLSRGEPIGFGRFYLRRAFRVLPAYLVVLALYFCLPGFREASGIQPLWQFLTYTVNLLIDYEHNQAFSHVWSLCVEEHFYLLFPLLAWWLMHRPSTAKFIATCVLLVLVGLLLRDYAWRHMTHFVEDVYYPTYNRLDGLLAGVVLATIQAFRPRLWQRLQQQANVIWLPAGLALVGLAMWLFRERTAWLSTVIGYPLLSFGMAMLVLAGTAQQGWLGRWRIPGARWIALISYSLYLCHKAVFHFVERTLVPPLGWQGVPLFLVYAIAALLGGALLHYAIERPFLRLRERLPTARGNAAAEVTAQA